MLLVGVSFELFVFLRHSQQQCRRPHTQSLSAWGKLAMRSGGWSIPFLRRNSKSSIVCSSWKTVAPNPSIERTSQRPLRALCAAAHVER